MKTTFTNYLLSSSSNAAVVLPSRTNCAKKLLIAVTFASSLMFVSQYALAQEGTVFSYTLKTVMSNTGIDADARGTINLLLSRNAKGENQRLKISPGKLDPNTAYHVHALIGNNAVPINVADFTADQRGAAKILFAKDRQGTATPGAQLLPAALDPLCNVRELHVVDGGGQIVLRGLLPLPNGGRYVVSRPLVNSEFISSAAGTLRITATTRNALFRFLASGLNPGTDYVLSVNGGAGQTLTSDGAGKLKLATLPQGFTNPLELHALALRDTSGNLILSTGGIGIPCNLPPVNPDTTPPSVNSTEPVNAATGVPINQNIRITFSEAMAPSTINTTTMTLQQGATPVAGAVTYTGNTATFAPASNLDPNTIYTATIATGATDLAGNALASNLAWSFTTGAAADTTAPTVSSTVPADAATGVSASQNIAATFSEAMNPSTITTVTMTLRRGVTPVAGTVTYAGNTATFTPANVLDLNTVYTARVTTGATDVAGNPLANAFVWSFTTGGPTAGQAPVALGSAGTFAVLAGSTVASTSFTVINDGDVGVSPGTAVDGFPPGAINNGTIHSADTAAVQAKLDLTTAYNDAAGRTVGAVTVAGNLGGQTLIPGLYKSTGSLEISSGDLTLDAQGDANAVFIFQITSTLTTTSDRKIFLTGNAKAANVFWQVGTSATLGTISIFKGTIMADQSIALTTGAHLEGRALARSGAVTLDASTITIPVP